MANSMKTQGRVLFKRSTIAACVMAATAAHVQAQEAASDDPALLEEVVVYGIQQSLQNAQDIKREAATVKDVITASDIGALPDKSVVEALQRVPGVAIERFEASDDPDHFSVEGGNVTVRGLNRVRAEFNGRDAFSAGADGGMNFSDIPPELVGSVEVSKNSTADLIEGGIAGTINLITRKPFDDESLVAGATVKASYGDLIEEVNPSFSGIVSNVWDTDAGTFGALFSVSASNFTSRGDSIGVYNYFPKDVEGVGNDAITAIIPNTGSARQQFNDRDRLGLAGSLQYRNPSETVKATLEFIRSDSTLAWNERFIEFPEQPFSSNSGSGRVFPGDDLTFDNCPEDASLSNGPCQFRSGTLYGGAYAWGDANTNWVGTVPYIAATRAREDERTINDASFNLEFTPNDNLTVWADFQYVDATTSIYDVTAHGKFFSDVYLDLRDDDNPVIEFLDRDEFSPITPDTTDYTNDSLNAIISNRSRNGADGIEDKTQSEAYFFRSAMDHVSDNEGEEVAFQLDAEYAFDDSWVTKVKTGIRFSNREVTVRESAYNWGAVSETWAGNSVNLTQQDVDELVASGAFSGCAADDCSADGDSDTDEGNWRSGDGSFNFDVYQEMRYDLFDGTGAYESFSFESHLKDNAFQSNNTFLFPSLNLVSTSDNLYNTLQQQAGYYRQDWQPVHMRDGTNGSQFLPSEIYVTEEDRSAAYIRADFGSEDGDIRYSGNFGVRYVTWQLSSTGASNYPDVPSDDFLATDAERAALNLPPLSPKLSAEDIAFQNNAAGATYTAEGEEFKRFLPSFNIKAEVTEDLIARFAISESIYLPELGDVRNQREISASNNSINQVVVDDDGNPVLDDNGNPQQFLAGVEQAGYFANGAGNPYLQPELSRNLDLALEWYFADVGSLTATYFHKKVRDYFRESTEIEAVLNPSTGAVRNVASTKTVNAGTAKIQGYELAFQTTFGGIHESLESFGIQSSYTFIDGSAQDNSNFQPTAEGDELAELTFRQFTDLPLEGLSEHNANLVLFYDNSVFQTRFAYSWRSDYLLNSRDVIAFSPVYGEATGQLDWSASYAINDNFKVGLEANNLTNEVTKTSIQYNQDGVRTPRSYFANDRRFAVYVQATF